MSDSPTSGLARLFRSAAIILPFGVAGLAIFGAVIAVIWFPIAYRLGRRYEDVRGDSPGGGGSAGAHT